MHILIKELLEAGISKYAIAKNCKVTWNTVQCWCKGFYEPTLEHNTTLSRFHKTILHPEQLRENLKADEDFEIIRLMANTSGEIFDSKRFPKETERTKRKILTKK